jgi:putative ABC transport system substrate-binding protein
MNRRETMIALFALGAAPLYAYAQTPKPLRRIVVLSAAGPVTSSHHLAAFRGGLKALAWIEGDNIVIEVRWADGKYSVLDALAADAVAMKPDVIFAPQTIAALAAQRATKDIPIVFATPIDPIGDGLIANWARPGGNITGLSTISRELGAKRLQLLKEFLPALSRVAVLNDPAAKYNAAILEVVQSAAAQLGIGVSVVNATNESELDAAYGTLSRERAEALFVMEGPFFFRHQAKIVARATAARLPSVYPIGEYADAGGLMVYGVNYPEQYRRAATYVDKILRGAKPGDLPVEQPTTFELIINVKAAKALGLAIPQAIFLRADRVIE